MAVDTHQRPKQVYEFGPFRVDAEKDQLLRQGEAVPLTPKSFQVLLVLMRHSKEVVTKDDLLKTVWPDTFVEEANLSRNIFLLRKALGESPQDHQYIVTVPGRGYRFAQDVQLVPEREVSIVEASHTNVEIEVEEGKGWRPNAVAAVIVVAAAAGGFALWSHHAPALTPVLTEKDTIVLADFANSTGDPVFDEALRQGLAVQLEQSPYVSLVSDARMRQALQLMGQSADARVDSGTAYQICQRTDSAVVVDGSIAAFGNEYVLGLRAINCRNGDSIADEQERANRKEQVLAAMDRTAVKLRQKLGESHDSLERFDTPLEQATTPSLEALQAYSLGRKNMVGKAERAAAIPFFKRAIQLDPNFGMAYAAMGSDYWTLGETTTATENVRKAYELRAHVSEAEKFYIDATYFHYVSGNLEKARQVYELAAQTFPRYTGTPLRLCTLYTQLGQHEKALEQILEAIRLDPSRAINYTNLVESYINLGRLDDATAAARETQAKQLDSTSLRRELYRLAFLRNDAAALAEQWHWAAGKSDAERVLLSEEGDTAAYFGQLRRSRELSSRAAESAMRAEQKDVAADYEVRVALTEALYGNSAEARQRVRPVLEHPTPRDAQFGAALALAVAGDIAGAQSLADELAKRFPEDTIVQFHYLPTVRAQIALDRGQSVYAIDLLRPVAPYELGMPGNDVFSPSLYPIYLRGNAYLAMHQGQAAATEFQKISAHPGLAGNQPIAALARLQLGRTYAMSGDTASAKVLYQEFLALWKDADPDVPVLRQAKSEYANLR